MQENLLYEYAVIRVVPRVEREEFLNVGVILFCREKKFLQTKFVLDHQRIHAFSPKTDIEELRARLHAFELICKGGKAAGTIGEFPIAERFRWLTASRSTIVQSSAVHPGLCDSPQKTLDKLFEQLVED